MPEDPIVVNGCCSWGRHPEIYRRYHDEEWGRPCADDQRLFEKICLEGFQSGLSWLTILKKRDNFRAAFANFDFHQVAAFTADDEARCVADAGIVRHRGKIRSTINNAQRALDLVAEFGSLAAYFWSWEPTERDYPGVVSQTPDSIALSKDLRRRGWTFVGPTTAYAFMQAMGLVNDHPPACSARTTCTLARNSFIKPVCKVPPTPG